MDKLGKALQPVIMAAAIAVAFGAMMFLTVWYGPDCRSPRRSVSIGGAVPGSGLRGRAMNAAPLSHPAFCAADRREPFHWPRRLLSWGCSA
jgi:hypothetical protein